MKHTVVSEAEWLPAAERQEFEASVRSLMAENRVTLARRWNTTEPVLCTYHAPSWEKPHLSHFITGAWEVHYPHQWFWDSCAHAIVLASLDPGLAREEVRSVLYAQRPDGFIPHLVMHPGHRHSLGMALGRLGRSRHRSPYLQPPLLAEAVAHIYAKTQDRDFLAEVLPRVVEYYDYIYGHRCPSGDGLAEIIISYESGMDRSPEYDGVYGKSTGGSMWRAPIIGLMLHHWRLKHDLPRILASQRFRVKDLLFNCIYARNQRVLAQLLETAGDRYRAGMYRERAVLTEAAILSKMQSRETGLFHSLDARHGRDSTVPAATLSAFMPLLLDTISRSQVERLLEKLTDSAEFWTTYPVPTQPISAAAVTPKGHVIWRGLQTWVLPNWLIYVGLKLQAERFPDLAQELSTTADNIARRSYELVRQHGFREYYHSQTGEPGGAVHFSWSGLVWDMVQ